MKRNRSIKILTIVLCMFLIAGCGNAAVPPQEPPAPIEAESNTQSSGAEEKVAENTAVPTETAKATEAVKDEAKQAAITDKANATDAAKEAETDALEINWDDVKTLDTPVTMYAQKQVNIRKGPDTQYDRLGTLSLNDEVNVIGECKNSPWKEIKFNDDVAFVHGDFLGIEKIDLEALKAAEEAAAATAAAQAPQQQAQAAQPAQPAQPVASAAGTLFIGDSRTCQMRAATGGGKCGWICEYATGYDWFADTAIPQADPLIGNGTKVVICMGVNDPGSLNSYANKVNEKAAEWVNRGAKVYYVSINPVDHPYEDKTPNIDSFNAQMPGLLANVKWIDTASVVKQGGFVLEDGIHYDAAGNVSIYNMIIRSLK